MAGGEFDESKHPRDEKGRFAVNGGLMSRLAKHATRLASRLYARATGKRPDAMAHEAAHDLHAMDLRKAANANVQAAHAHNEAARIHNEEGNHEAAKAHADAAAAHAEKARQINHEADEHAAISGAERQDHDRDSGAVKDAAHNEAHEAAGHKNKAHRDEHGRFLKKNGNGEGGEKGGEKGGEHEGEGEDGEEGEEHEGLAGWIKEKLESTKEHLHEGMERATEAEEQALEGNIYAAGAGAIEGAVGGVASKAFKKSVGGAGTHAVLSKGLEHFAKKHEAAEAKKKKKERE